jgi:hypothetical protein
MRIIRKYKSTAGGRATSEHGWGWATKSQSAIVGDWFFAGRRPIMAAVYSQSSTML